MMVLHAIFFQASLSYFIRQSDRLPQHKHGNVFDFKDTLLLVPYVY